MRILIASDTHGQLSLLNKIIEKHKADAVIHCGDFGFMSHDKAKNLTDRELSLNIKHWPHLPITLRKLAWDMSTARKIRVIQEHKVLGEFDEFVNGNLKFKAPIYAVWGNHEDVEVIKDTIESPVPNLHLLGSKPTQLLDSNIDLYGVGGNISINRFFSKPLSSNLYPFMTFQEWAEVRQNMKSNGSNGKKNWLITHVSPGKEPILELFGIQLRPEMWFSGHLGAPFPQHYSLFTFLDDPDFADRLKVHLKMTKSKFNMWKEEMSKWLLLKEMIDKNELDTIGDLKDQCRKVSGYSEESYEFKRLSKNSVSYFKHKRDGHKFDCDYPDVNTFKMINGNSHLLTSPVDLENNGGNDNSYFGRKSSKYVKGTWYWNMPDVYAGGYLIIDTKPDAEEWQVNPRYSISVHGFL